MEDRIFQEAFQEFLNGTSLRKIEKQFNEKGEIFNRNSFSERCKKEFPKGSKEREKLEKILQHNKQQIKEVKEEQLKELCDKIFKGEIGIKEAAKMAGVNRETFNERFAQYINNSNDINLKKQYIKYKQERNPDYSFINFRAMLIEMLRNNITQTEMASIYGIPPRTISREIEKLKEDEKELYSMAKEFAKRKMQKKNFSEFERYLVDKVLKKYENEDIIKIGVVSKEEQEYIKSKELIKNVEQLEGSNLEKTEKLGVSISTIRRAKVRIKEYENKQRMEQEKIEEEKGE